MKRLTLLLTLLPMALAMGQEASPLASGRWWRLTVGEEGVHALGTADLPALRGAEVAHICLYGDGGAMLSTLNAEVPTTGMTPVAISIQDNNGNGIFDDGDRLLFHAESTDTWRYAPDAAQWQFGRHAYAAENHYLLGLDVDTPLHIATSAPDATGADTANTYTAVAVHDRDLVNIMHTGQKWMGERFATGSDSRHLALTLPATASGVATIRYGLASVASGTSSFRVAAPGYSASPTITASEVYRTYTGQLSTQGGTVGVDITFVPYNGSATGYLDFIELTAPAAMQWQGQALAMRTVAAGARHYSLAGAPTDAEVWETYAGRPARRMATSRSADGATHWADTVSGPALYVAFRPALCPSPTAISPLANQDLHGAAAADLIIVSHPAYLQQAARIASAHELFDTLTTLVVTDQQVFNEYSAAKADPMAIRTFLRHLRQAHPERPPRFLVLLGKATYDHRDLEGNHFTSVVTYQTPQSYDEDGNSFSSDDMMGYLDDNERGQRSESVDISIGRLPAKTQAEADLMADKIEAYLTRRDLLEGRGDWRNNVILLADDADPSRVADTFFTHSSERIALGLGQAHPELYISRLYADAFQQQSGAIGSTYPDLNNALLQQLAQGCILLNYIGHGSTNYIGTERYISIADIEALTNYDRLPLVMASTCSYGRFDLSDVPSGAETFMLARGGAIGVISASRPISHNHNFDNAVLTYALDGKHTIGEAMRLAKNENRVAVCIGLVGDPALRLSRPDNRVEVTAINHRPVTQGVADTAEVLSEVTVEGEVRTPSGELISDFDGWVYPVVYDRPVLCRTLGNDNPGANVAFTQQKNILYKGSHAVSGGRFSYSFIVPRDVAYRYDYGRLSHYAQSTDLQQAAGAYTQLMFGGLADSADTCASHPTVSLYIGDTNFRDGGLASASPTLVAYLADRAGINAVGSGIGHDITAILDGNPGSLVVLNDLYQPDLADSRCGWLRYSLAGLAPGRHTLTLKAWNIYNLSGSQTISFVVPDEGATPFASVSASPNPATTAVRLSLETSAPATITRAELNIYSAQGQLMLSATPQVADGSFVVGPVVWDVSGTAPGIYLARFTVHTTDGNVRHFTTKCVVR